MYCEKCCYFPLFVLHKVTAIEFDPAKDAINIEKHGLSLARADEFDMAGALIVADTRFDYGEDRFNAYGLLDGKLHALTFMVRDGNVRAISLRPASRKERENI